MGGVAQGAVLPASLVLGEGNVRGTMEGSIVDGHVRTTWDAPAAGAAGTAEFCRDATRFSCKVPPPWETKTPFRLYLLLLLSLSLLLLVLLLLLLLSLLMVVVVCVLVLMAVFVCV